MAPATTTPRERGSAELVIISAGSNLPSRHGTPAETLRAALSSLVALAGESLRCSSLWQTDPVDCPPEAPRFINAVAVFESTGGDEPEEFLNRLQALESGFGRVRDGTPNSSRSLDLDLICWGARIQNSDTLTLPHPRALQRSFVLRPLAELEPGFVIPGQSLTVTELLVGLPLGHDRKIP